MRLDLPQVTLVCFENRDPRRSLSLMAGMLEMVNFGDVRWLNSHTKYSQFVLSELTAYASVRTTHAMYIHLDGFIINPELWDPKWLDYDYIGAPWPEGMNAGRVGNGGFSLRTKNLMQKAALLGWLDMNNDILICCKYREDLEEMGCKFAPVEEAAKFSVEHR